MVASAKRFRRNNNNGKQAAGLRVSPQIIYNK